MSINKISILTSEFPPQPGGIGNHTVNLARGLAKEGYSVEVICDIRSEDGKEEILYDSSQNFKVIRIKRRYFILLTYLERIIEAIKLSRRTELIIASGKFQLWIGAFLAMILKRKYIAIAHGSELLLSNPFYRILTNLSLAKYDKIIAVSKYTKELLPCSLMAQVEVVHNGFHLECSDEKVVPHMPNPKLITVGNVNSRKGQQNVIKALPYLLGKFPNLEYGIVGIPTQRKQFEVLAKKLKVERAVRFYGVVSENRKCRLLQKADIFIMLSERTKDGDVEGFGIAVLEANALGLPAIGAKGCGIEEAIKNKHSGLLVNNKEPQEIARAVEVILNDYDNFSYNAKQWSNLFSWKKVIKDYIHIIEN